MYLKHFFHRTRKIHAALKLEEEVSSKERISPREQKSSGGRNIVNAD